MNAGRKRSFDREEALDKATRLFWANGYSGTSLTDLTDTLGINKPSLYAAFGNKETLFRASLEHYITHYGEPLFENLYQPENTPLKERLKAYMESVARLVTDPELPKGCLLVKSTCESGSEAIPEEITASLNAMKKNTETTINEFLNREKQQGELAQDRDIEQLTSYIMVVLFGIGVLAKNDADMDTLQPVIDMAVMNVFSD